MSGRSRRRGRGTTDSRHRERIVLSSSDEAGAPNAAAPAPAPDAAATDAAVRAALEAAHRAEWARVLAATVPVAGTLDVAEDCTQDAFVGALSSWTRDGIPRNPGAWLTVSARRKALDAHRRAATLRSKLPLMMEPASDQPTPDEPDYRYRDGGPDAEDARIPDDRLRLIFTCCHPALAREAQIALTLRLLCGLSTSEIARAFLVSESTMAARVTRAKKKIAAANIPYRVPAARELPDRLDSVLTVLHLVFTTGHTAPSGPDLVRSDLTRRALDLTRVVTLLMPDEPEASGLLALMLFTDARRATRVGDDGAPVLLADQDRDRWDRAAVAEGEQLLLTALRRGPAGRFVLQAAIAGVHAQAPTYADTDWAQVVGLYDRLRISWPSPVVELNRAVAISMASGPEAGLRALEQLDTDALRGYHYLPAARADLLRQLGRRDEAAEQYRQALEVLGPDGNSAELAFLQGRLTEVTEAPD